jgi:hypothetical protein
LAGFVGVGAFDVAPLGAALKVLAAETEGSSFAETSVIVPRGTSSLLETATPRHADAALVAIPIAPALRATASTAHAARLAGRWLIGIRRAGCVEFMACAAIYRLVRFRAAAEGQVAASD